MSISSVNNNSWLSYLTNYTSKTNKTSASINVSALTQLISSTDQQSSVLLSNTDGDTVQLSTQAINMNSASVSEENNMEDLINKIADGSASDEEIEEFTSLIKEGFEKMPAPPPPAQDADSDSSEIEDLINKVVDDSASEEDIKELATKMKEHAEKMPAPPGKDSDSATSEIEDLISKITDGSASEEDIQELATKMKEHAEKRSSMGTGTLDSLG
ncbi:hypothetical protein [Candidatus Formimonas warabiya]|uniref:Uncharacterized protein n=1 Tax=Formimonas warabiya TaxID=1761012 RepID=A0A3G1KX94_FORW1|nr:hypothetical protein [Candidatus Formimonas warabiya]ATW27061.1 hypothetical protein DCMF_21905 [Candidatus Formimonas warabiya]